MPGEQPPCYPCGEGPFEPISEIIHLQVLVRYSVTVTGKPIYSIRQRLLFQFTDENTESWGIPVVVVRFAKCQSCKTQRVALSLLSPLTHCDNEAAERQGCQCPFPQEELPSWVLGKFSHHSLQPRVLLACPGGYHVPISMPDGQAAVPNFGEHYSALYHTDCDRLWQV